MNDKMESKNYTHCRFMGKTKLILSPFLTPMWVNSGDTRCRPAGCIDVRIKMRRDVRAHACLSLT